MTTALARLEGMLADPAGPARRWREASGGKVVGWLPPDVPVELLHAAGALPFCLLPVDGKGVRLADAHLQTWACSLARCALEAALAGRLAFLDGLVIPHLCDTTRLLGGIWRQCAPLPWQEDYLPPRQVDRPSALPYLTGELKRLGASLGQFTGGCIREEDLGKSIALYNRQRRLLRTLFQRQADSPGLLPLRLLYGAVGLAMRLPPEETNSLLQGVLAELPPGGGQPGMVRLLASGVTWEPPELLDLLEEAGATLVADDLQTGRRYFADDAAEGPDPWRALAEKQLRLMPGCAWDSRARPRARLLSEAALKARARGVLFLHLKFCEPENFDYPYLKRALGEAGYPSLLLENDLQAPSRGQLATRLEAFVELLRGAPA